MGLLSLLFSSADDVSQSSEDTASAMMSLDDYWPDDYVDRLEDEESPDDDRDNQKEESGGWWSWW